MRPLLVLNNAAVDSLADNNFGDTRGDGLAGPIGLFIIVMMAVATVLLIRNMNSRLRRLPDRFPSEQTERFSSRDQPVEPAAPSPRDADQSPADQA